MKAFFPVSTKLRFASSLRFSCRVPKTEACTTTFGSFSYAFSFLGDNFNVKLLILSIISFFLDSFTFLSKSEWKEEFEGGRREEGAKEEGGERREEEGGLLITEGDGFMIDALMLKSRRYINKKWNKEIYLF